MKKIYLSFIFFYSLSSFCQQTKTSNNVNLINHTIEIFEEAIPLDKYTNTKDIKKSTSTINNIKSDQNLPNTVTLTTIDALTIDDYEDNKNKTPKEAKISDDENELKSINKHIIILEPKEAIPLEVYLKSKE